MGTIGSKVEMVDVEGTPAKCQISHRQLDEDPRSPTTDILRTPIMVDKTPAVDLDLDPRSPTPGIWRTPINNFTIKKEEVKSVKDESKPLLDESLEQLTKTTAPVAVPEQTQRPEELAATPVAELQQLSLSDVDESSTLLSCTDKVTKKPKNLKTQPKKLFYDKKSKPLSCVHKSVLAPIGQPRSPLSTVVIDANSPRVIVQRKQTKKIAAARHCRLDAATVMDKENVDM